MRLPTLTLLAMIAVSLAAPKEKRAVKILDPKWDKWPNKTVPYFIAKDGWTYITRSEIVAKVKAALEKLSAATCLRFPELTNPSAELKALYPSVDDQDYIQIVNGKGCTSRTGRLGGMGAQMMSLGKGCELEACILHEFMHAIGFYHEQNRSDRDDYVIVNFDNIVKTSQKYFMKKDPKIEKITTPYNTKSIMHYAGNSQSINGQPTIVRKADHGEIPFPYDFQFTDAKEINLEYCKDVCHSELACQNDGYTDPKNCAVCRCPDEFTGTLCEARKASTSHTDTHAPAAEKGCTEEVNGVVCAHYGSASCKSQAVAGEMRAKGYAKTGNGQACQAWSGAWAGPEYWTTSGTTAAAQGGHCANPSGSAGPWCTNEAGEGAYCFPAC